MIHKTLPAADLVSNLGAHVAHGFNAAAEAIGKVENFIVVNEVIETSTFPQPRAEGSCLSHRIVENGVTCAFRLAGRTTGCSVRVALATRAAIADLGRKTVGAIRIPWRKRGQAPVAAAAAQLPGASSLADRLRTRKRIRRLRADVDRARKSMIAALTSAALAGSPKPQENEQVQKNLAAIRAGEEIIRDLLQSSSYSLAEAAPVFPAAPAYEQMPELETPRIPIAPGSEPSISRAPKTDVLVATVATPVPPARPEPQVPPHPAPAASIPAVAQSKVKVPAPAPVQPPARATETSAVPEEGDVGMSEALELSDLPMLADFAFSSDRLLFENAIRCVGSEDLATCETGVRALEKLEGHVVIQALVILSRHPVDTIRTHALDALLERPGSPALFQVIQQMVRNDPSAKARIAAIRVLFKIDPVLSIPYLSKALLDENTMVRRRAVMCLSWSGAQEAIPDLILALEDPDVEVRCATVQALAQLRSKLAIPYLIKALDDSDVQVRLNVWRTLQALTGRKLGFKPRGSSESRARGKANWENWWKETESGFSL